jgi:precorrin-6B methylase 2
LFSCAAIAPLLILLTGPAYAQKRAPDVPYVPTPPQVVEKMLELANIRSSDFLMDLGSGDGRIVITAARKYRCRGMGIDINPERIREAVRNANKAGVSHLVRFQEQDLFQADLSKATVVTLYLLPDINMKLRPKLWKELRPGTRVVSHSFDMGDWKPDKTVEVDWRTIYFWRVPETPPVASAPR